MSTITAVIWTVLGAFWIWLGLFLRKKGHPYIGWFFIIVFGAVNILGAVLWFALGYDLTKFKTAKADFGSADRAA